MSSGSFTFGVVWRANAVRVTVLEGIRCASGGKRSLERLPENEGGPKVRARECLTRSTLYPKVQCVVFPRATFPRVRVMSSTAASVAAESASRERSAMARRLLLDAIVLGGLADAFLHDGFGIGLLAWMIIFAATFVHIKRRQGGLSREQTGWLVAALFFAGSFAWRDSGTLGFYDFLAMLTALALLGATSAAVSPVRTVLGQRVARSRTRPCAERGDGCSGGVPAAGCVWAGYRCQDWSSGRDQIRGPRNADCASIAACLRACFSAPRIQCLVLCSSFPTSTSVRSSHIS